ncbi:chorismate synthase [Lujinxingia litoralis]|uniref:Chorismate synthase n=1 Tax=Lujinxingia litoralis TaxID=2211119 RepID=A0A328C5J4_9DELT|nr:chorismate synthase [Lujinxingia litoralis]RAL22749.1 chorismate synthase [Lujinxingia litoralis]
MFANTFGTHLRLTTFGESHGPAMGAVIDGMPAGVAIDLATHIQPSLNRRRPGQSAITTARNEADAAEILSGVFDGKTLGTPICVVVRNTNARSSDYRPDYYRPGHADRTWQEKFGHRDHRGGGRASGRETLARVIGGAFAARLLPPQTRVVAFTRQIGEHRALDVPGDLSTELIDRHPTRCPDLAVAERISQELLECKARGDSRGGIIELHILNCPIGLGEPVFAKLKARLADAMMGIGAVVGVSLGDGFHDATTCGIDFHTGIDGQGPAAGISPAAQGIQGGISNGEPITLRVAFKPASTIGSMAREGRHDPCIVPRAVPVVEAMANLVLADLLLARRLNQLP